MISDIYKNFVKNNKISDSEYTSDFPKENKPEIYHRNRKGTDDMIKKDNNKIMVSNYYQEIITYSYLSNLIKSHKIKYHALPDLMSISMKEIILPKYFLLNSGVFINMNLNEFKKCIFQIYMACMTFNKIKLRHNDLHIDNILYEISNDKFKLDYEIIDDENNTRKFLINCDKKYKIIDYEVSCINDGDDKICIITDFHTDDNYNISNEYEPSFDFLTFIFKLIKCINQCIFYDKFTKEKQIEFISSILRGYYETESCDKFISKFKDKERPSGDIVRIPLEPLIKLFELEDIFESSAISNKISICHLN